MGVVAQQISRTFPKGREKSDHVVFEGGKRIFDGAEPVFNGAEPVFKGAEPVFNGPEPVFKGAELVINGPELVFKDPEPGVKLLRHSLHRAWPIDMLVCALEAVINATGAGGPHFITF